MKSLSLSELQEFVKELNIRYEGAHLQRVEMSAQGCGLGFWTRSEGLLWLAVELIPLAPTIFLTTQTPAKSRPKPISLFLKANAVGSKYLGASVDLDLGRVLEIKLSKCRLRVFLIPHRQNLHVEADGKQIHFFKPKDLKVFAPDQAPLSPAKETLSVSTIGDVLMRHPPSTPPEENQIKRATVREKGLEALYKQRTFAVQDIQRIESKKWKETGLWLKENQSLNVDEVFRPYVDPQKSLSENIQVCFQKSKDQAAKLERARRRLATLDQQIEVQQVSNPEALKTDTQESPGRNLASKSIKSKVKLDLRSRKKILTDNLVVWIGKSAEDNLTLLRLAKPWHLWIHLRDYTGAYGIIDVPRSTKVPDAALKVAAQFVIAESKSTRTVVMEGDTVEIAVSECRYVKPVRGGPKGLVTYAQARILRIKFSASC